MECESADALEVSRWGWWPEAVAGSIARLCPKNNVSNGEKNPPTTFIHIVHATNAKHYLRENKGGRENVPRACAYERHQILRHDGEKDPPPEVTTSSTTFVIDVVEKTKFDSSNNRHKPNLACDEVLCARMMANDGRSCLLWLVLPAGFFAHFNTKSAGFK